MEILINLFWFPLNFLYVAVNLALWGGICWGIYEGYKQLRKMNAN